MQHIDGDKWRSVKVQKSFVQAGTVVRQMREKHEGWPHLSYVTCPLILLFETQDREEDSICTRVLLIGSKNTNASSLYAFVVS